MNRFLVVLSLASANTLLLGQASNQSKTAVSTNNPLVERAERISKSFPPDVVVQELPEPLLSRSYCATPVLETRSVSFRPCRKPARTPAVAPVKAPEKPPRQIR